MARPLVLKREYAGANRLGFGSLERGRCGWRKHGLEVLVKVELAALRRHANLLEQLW